MKKIFFVAVCLVSAMEFSISAKAQTAGLPMPTKTEIESTIGGMGLSMGEKLSLRSILQGMQEQGAKVKENDSLTDTQKTAQIIKIRQGALDQTKKILTADQQKKLAALLLPKQ